MWTVSNLTDAKEACLKDQNCGMFYDSGGRGKWFYSCPFATKRNYGRMVRKSWSSVLYSKGKLYLSNLNHGSLLYEIVFFFQIEVSYISND